MSICSAFGCTNRPENNKISYYQIPREKRGKMLRKRWLQNVKREGPLPADKSFYMCAEHFEESCFGRDLKKVRSSH